MKLFQRLVWVALALALALGSVQTLLQQHWAVPIILRAETFEDQKAEAAPAMPALAHDHAGAAAAHEHAQAHDHHAAGEPEWAPQDGAERTLWTWVANVLHVFALALLTQVVLAAWVAGHGRASSALRLGVGLAVAGWLSLHLWPALGLPAEIPGMDAARLGSRQGWWLLAVAGAGSACAVLAFGRGAWRWLAAAAALALPFAVGAPHIAADPLAGFSPDAQALLRELGARFVVVTHALAASLWLMLGLAGSLAFVRWVQPLIVGQVQVRSDAVAAGA